MHHSFIDKYSFLDSPLHKLDARLKIALAFLLIIGVIITPLGHFTAFIIFGALSVILWLISRLPAKHLISRLALALPFLAVMCTGIVLGQTYTGGDRWYYLLHITCRALLAITFLILLTSTTPFPRLLEGLKWFRLPKVLHSLLSFIYRFIYIIIDEFQRLNRGRKSREFGHHLSLSWRARSWMIGTFFIRSIERSERVYQAMLARGYLEK